MNSRRRYDQWQKEITKEVRRTPVYIECDCGSLALKVYREECFQCNQCSSKYDKSFRKIEETKFSEEQPFI